MSALRPKHIFLFCFFLACTSGEKNIVEPNHNPWILKPNAYVPSEGKLINMDSLAEPESLPVKMEVQKAEISVSNSSSKSKPQKANPTYVPANPKVIYLDSMPEPKYYADKGRRVEAAWPKWKPAQPAYPSAPHFPYFYLDQDQGLSGSSVQDVVEDKYGRFWIAMNSGLNLWDGNGLMNFTKKEGLKGYDVNCIMEDRKGNIWIGTRGHGISLWDGNGFIHFSANEEMRNLSIWAFMEDKHGNIWIGTSRNGFFIWDGEGFTNYTKKQGLGDNNIWDIMEDRHGDIWITSKSERGGLHKWAGNKIVHYTSENGLSGNRLNKLWEDKYGNIWMALHRDGGLNAWIPAEDGTSGGFLHYTEADGITGSARKFAEDKRGRIWMSDGNGISIWTPNKNGVEDHFTHYDNTDGLRFDRVWDLLSDRTGNMWIGSRAEGLMMWNMQGALQYTPSEGLSRRVYSQLVEDRKGNIWIGRNSSGVVKVWNGSTFTNFNLPKGAGAYTATSLFEDRKGNIWIGEAQALLVWNGSSLTKYHFPDFTYITSILEDKEDKIWFSSDVRGGIGILKGEEYVRYTTKEGLVNDQVNCLLRDSENNIWAGTEGGISVFSPPDEDGKREIIHYTTENGLKNNNVLSLLEDHKGNIWIGTDEGISVWHAPQEGINGGFFHYSVNADLMGNRIFSLFEDDEHTIWAGTNQGLSRLISTGENQEIYVKTYRKEEGVRGTSIRKILVDRKKTMWLASNKSLESMDLNTLQTDTAAPQLFIRELQPFFDPVDWRRLRETSEQEKDHSVKVGDLSFSGISFDSIPTHANLPHNPSFPHNFNHFTFSWTGTHGVSSSKLQYTYFLEGKDKAWSPLIKDYKVTFQDIPSGTYAFKVRAVGKNGKWSKTAAYVFTIRPPWWLTAWAYLFYILSFLTSLYYLFRYLLRRRLKMAAMAQELELNAYKTNLYANITHEFRTPLTIILGMVRQIKTDPKKWYNEGLEMIHRNGRQLLKLVNQMLDLSKLDKGKLQLKPRRGELVAYLNYLLQAFSSHAAGKNIQLHFLKEVDQLEMDFDADQLSKIVSNLLSNAVKFTPNDGHVYVSLRHAQNAPSAKSALGTVEIAVKDTGRGIPEEAQPYIFDRFYQVESANSEAAGGSGIGLSLVKELATLMEGDIEVQSKLDEGTTFTVCLPIRRSAEAVKQSIVLPEAFQEAIPPMSSPPITSKQAAGDLPPSTDATILLIEDNRDVMRYLASCLESEYHLEYAVNGREGVERAIELTPDLIISDVMMPEMDGYEVTAALKNDERTSHIPILLLTAKADRDSKIEGLERGADAYLSKPFDPKELEVRLRKLIQLRQKLQSRYASFSAPLDSKDPNVQKQDVFIRKFRKIVEDHIEDETFGVLQIARAMRVSRTQLHNKLKALTGKSTSHVIRSIRLQKARTLLLTSDLNVSEVAYAVGFKNTTYFSSCFSKEFGLPPSELKTGKI